MAEKEEEEEESIMTLSDGFEERASVERDDGVQQEEFYDAGEEILPGDAHSDTIEAVGEEEGSVSGSPPAPSREDSDSVQRVGDGESAASDA
ncbi:MAG: hypothetical protein VX563_02420, partial [Planctomycetota bacterium]|nr:hypothetical protein [Planctomycetota bacterium]